MTAHPELEELAAYAADDLDAAAAAEVRGHVSGCRECLAELAAFGELTADLSSLPVVPMPAEVVASLDAALAAERATSVAPQQDRTVVPLRATRRSSIRAKLAGLAAGSAAAALIGVVAIGALTNRGANDKSDGGSATSAGADTAASRRAFNLVHTGSAYTQDNVLAETRELLTAPNEDTKEMESAPSGVAGGSADQVEPFGSGADFQVPEEQLTRCVNLLLEQAKGPQPELVDIGTFEGSPAIVVLQPSRGDSYDVWFLDALRCGTDDAGDDVGLLYQYILRP